MITALLLSHKTAIWPLLTRLNEISVPQEGGTSLPHLLTKAGLLQPYVPLPSRVARSYKRYKSRNTPTLTCRAPKYSLYHLQAAELRIPEGRLGENQLLGSSMSLSPRHWHATDNLHVSNTSSFLQGFPRSNNHRT